MVSSSHTGIEPSIMFSHLPEQETSTCVVNLHLCTNVIVVLDSVPLWTGMKVISSRRTDTSNRHLTGDQQPPADFDFPHATCQFS